MPMNERMLNIRRLEIIFAIIDLWKDINNCMGIDPLDSLAIHETNILVYNMIWKHFND